MTEQTTPVASERLIHIHQGECRISEDPRVVLTTMLGSCIAACLRDPIAGVGGMNHFLLPDTDEGDHSASLRYGANAMELLVNGLLSIGAKRERLEAKLFGGGRMSDGLRDIGEKNTEFAWLYPNHERKPRLRARTRGRDERRTEFCAVDGRV